MTRVHGKKAKTRHATQGNTATEQCFTSRTHSPPSHHLSINEFSHCNQSTFQGLEDQQRALFTAFLSASASISSRAHSARPRAAARISAVSPSCTCQNVQEPTPPARNSITRKYDAIHQQSTIHSKSPSVVTKNTAKNASETHNIMGIVEMSKSRALHPHTPK